LAIPHCPYSIQRFELTMIPCVSHKWGSVEFSPSNSAGRSVNFMIFGDVAVTEKNTQYALLTSSGVHNEKVFKFLPRDFTVLVLLYELGNEGMETNN